MKAPPFRSASLIVFLVLLVETAHAFAPSYRQNKNSPVLKHLGFEVHSIWERSGERFICEVIFNENSKDLPKQGASVLLTDDLCLNELFQSDHTLAPFTSYTAPKTANGESTKRFGFRFYVHPKLVKDTYILFWLQGTTASGKFGSGEYEVPLREFLPESPAQTETGSNGSPPANPTKNAPPENITLPPHKTEDRIREPRNSPGGAAPADSSNAKSTVK